MRRALLHIGLLFIVLQVNAQDVNGIDPQVIASSKPAPKTADQIFTYVQQMPKSSYDLGQYLSENIYYPDSAQKANISGRVIVQFLVNEDGSISDCKVVQGIGYGCDEEALRVIKNMPPWKPGKQDGKPVKVYFTQPIRFALPQNSSQQTHPDSHPINDGKKPYYYVQQMPAPAYDLNSYLQENLRYPAEARKNSVEGRVIIQFVVNEDGSISNCTVKKGIGSGCDEEALRVIESMPPWKPARQEGRAVKVYFTQPINFALTSK